MLEGRLGLDTARLPHADRHGLIYFDRGRLSVESGALTFVGSGGGGAPAGTYTIPHQSISMVLLGPGGSVTHDVLRLLARHNVGEDGVRFYTAPPLLPDTSTLARKQAGLWSDAKGGRMRVARKMYAMRLGEILPHRDIAVLRPAASTELPRGLPACAGMDPFANHAGGAAHRLPRRRGDGPDMQNVRGANGGAAPHARGWTRHGERGEHLYRGCPACAGMDPPMTAPRLMT